MALVNQVQISGYVATEPKVFGKDKNVGRIRIRWDKRKKVGDKWESEGNFFSVVVFGDDVDRLLGLQKGDKIMVVGRLAQNQKEDTKQEFIDIIATEFAFIPTGDKVKPQTDEAPSQEAQDFLDVS
jgi:single-stranded DNA-binding protein